MKLNNQHIVNKINGRYKEDVPPMFWIVVAVFALLIMSNVLG